MARQDEETGISDSEMTFLIALWAVEESAKQFAATVGRLSRVVARRRNAIVEAQRVAAPDVANDLIETAALHDEPPSRPAA